MFLTTTTLFYKLLFVVGLWNYQFCKLVQTKLSKVLGRNLLRKSKEEEKCNLYDLNVLE